MKTNFTKFPSVSGSNSYSMLCEELLINGSPTRSSYTVCQHTVLALKRIDSTSSFDSCATAIRAGKCRAVKMLEEVKTGERIYFIDGLEEMRLREIESRAAESATRNKRAATFGSRVTPKPEIKKPTVLVDIYAEAVNAEVNKTEENT
jgi:hypothetical protein